MKCGLLGRHLSHSYSPQIHCKLGNYDYQLFEVEPENLEQFLKSAEWNGLNVTIPYKKAVIPYCSTLSPQAKALGAVNTIIKNADGELIGHNSDYFGFFSLLEANSISVFGKKVLILGSGGASATCKAVLQKENANVITISRNGENHYGNLHLHSDASVIVNATPVGMYPHNGQSPIDLSLFPQLECVIDLIYNPARTKLLLDAQSRGIQAVNGLWMLVAQAKESAEWFNTSKIADDIIAEIHSELKSKMENIVLIGMPGCGKSTIGTLLAKRCGREFVDTDHMIIAKAGRSIPEIFAEYGEDGFRKIETSVLTEIGMRSNLVIATGGGCVTRQCNYPHLHQNSRIIWLKRDIAVLPTDGRPLSMTNSLEGMFKARAPLYTAFADIIVENDMTPENTANTILEAFYENSRH